MNKWIIFDVMGVVFTVGDDTNDLLVPFVQERNRLIDKEKINMELKQYSEGMEMRQITNDQAVVLLWSCIMKQSQNTRQTLDNVHRLWEEIKEFSFRTPLIYNEMHSDIEKSTIYNLTFDEVLQIFTGKRKLHRFPKKMAEFIYDSILILKTEFNSEAKRIFEKDDEIVENLKKFKGISSHKAYICYGVYKSFIQQRVDQEYFFECGCIIAIEDILEEINLIEGI